MNEEELLQKIKEYKQADVDLSRDEDLSIALMNLVSLEEHFYFTAMKTNDQKYLDMLSTVRQMRQQFLKKIVTNPQGEEWCISKHLLGASMRLIEVGTKEQSKKGKKAAREYYKAGFDLWSLFFAINLGMIKPQQINKEQLAQEDSKMGKISTMMKKIIDCCKEW